MEPQYACKIRKTFRWKHSSQIRWKYLFYCVLYLHPKVYLFKKYLFHMCGVTHHFELLQRKEL